MNSDTLTKFQRFVPTTVHRLEIKNADYNPRRINPEARKKLKKAVKKNGIVETLVWNKRTGNLVGGHQRLSLVDELEGTQDYRLTVSAIDVDERTEKELNIFLNNPHAQGDWDCKKLEAMIKELDCDISGIGFDPVDIQVLCDSPELAQMFADEADQAKGEIDKLAELKKRRAEAKKENQRLDDAEYYCVLVFVNRLQVDAFLRGIEKPTDSRYIDGLGVAERLGIQLPAIDPK